MITDQCQEGVYYKDLSVTDCKKYASLNEKKVFDEVNSCTTKTESEKVINKLLSKNYNSSSCCSGLGFSSGNQSTPQKSYFLVLICPFKRVNFDGQWIVSSYKVGGFMPFIFFFCSNFLHKRVSSFEIVMVKIAYHGRVAIFEAEYYLI